MEQKQLTREEIFNSDNSLIKKGKDGENFAEAFCKIKGFEYQKATKEEDLLGIDCHIDKIPTDVKNTSGIIFGAYRKNENRFQVRHPFRIGKSGTKSKNLLVVDVKSTSNSFTANYYGPISDYLIENYFNSLEDLRSFRSIINEYNFKSFEELNFKSIDSFLFSLVKRLNPLLKEGAKLSYFSEKKATDDCTIKLWKPDPALRKTETLDLVDDLPF